MSLIVRRLAIGLLVLVATAPVAFFLFVLGLVVHEAVMWPTATLTTAVFAALAASWVTDALTRDSKRSAINLVATRSLLWGLIPALLMLLITFSVTYVPLIVWMSITVTYASVAGVILASRHRTEETLTPLRGFKTLWWLTGSAAAVALVIFAASLFGLTGA